MICSEMRRALPARYRLSAIADDRKASGRRAGSGREKGDPFLSRTPIVVRPRFPAIVPINRETETGGLYESEARG